ncbi:putative DNA binding domain-containing protein [Sedimentibacter hydroxybenzoicus DSM 7310]|uniref:DNA binding domain-containing protein n=2 Tax=Sedimentibacter hydroxybenzoicus TaxID=29345 RepID=A0A974GWM0_SEDHY|nr:putative DNA binding domain-containing protein [Sedimentibacter hydroxybenzoicus DSM 7310]
MMHENNNIEYKREYTSDIKKEVMAFANSDGGVIYVGWDDDGNPYPLTDIDRTLTQITNSIRDSILPDVTMFVGYEVNANGIVITVQEGTHKPYFLPEKGLKPSGVYVRQGASSVPASFDQIREMIKLTDGDKFEAARSLSQELTFSAAAEEFSRCGVEFGENQMRTLGIIGTDELYTNLGLLLSDQCAHTVKFAIFNGTKKGEFKTRKEIDGSVLRQMRYAFDFLSLSNNLAATFSGLDRIEQYDYPEEVVREAMLNSIIHRDYAFSGSIIVNLYDDRMEFVSLGGLMPGLRAEDLFLGISQPRNEKLANVFYRLKHIESYGTGLRRIMQYYENFDIKPEIETTHGAFMLTLPNMNYVRPLTSKRRQKAQHKIIVEYLRHHPFITNEIVQELLSVKQTRAYTIIREMINEGIIIKNGSGKENNEYVLTE